MKIAWTVGLAFVGRALAQTSTLPVRTDENVIVAAYNIQRLGQKPHDYTKLAEVIQHFDVCGIIEVKVETGVAELVHALDVTDVLYGNTSKANMKRSKSELSDHLPVWAAFDVTRTDDD